MIKALIKKQFTESFRSYFVNPKTGRGRSKKGTTGMFVFFAVLMCFLFAVFFGFAAGLGSMLMDTQLEWLYYTVMGIVAIALGTFGSVFNTFSILYMAKDNELLLAMPIPPKYILLSRMSLVAGLSLLYSSLVWIPTILFCWIFGSCTWTKVVFQILLLFVLVLLVTVLTCVLGWVVAMISSRLKRKSFITVIVSVVFFGAYYYVFSHMSSFMNEIGQQGDIISEKLQSKGLFLVWLGQAATGEGIPMLLFSGIVIVLMILCAVILSRSFTKIVTRTVSVKKTVYKQTEVRAQSTRAALFRRELKRFTGSSTYMLNCGLGLVLAPALCIFALIRKEDVLGMIGEITAQVPMLEAMIPLIAFALVCVILSINTISTPSISLEGKHLWILQSLPVSGADVLEAKLNLHVVLNGCSATVSILIFSAVIPSDFSTIVIGIILAWMFVWVTGALGLILGLKRPNFQCSAEAIPVKQSLNPVLSWLIGWAILAAICGGFFLFHNHIEAVNYMIVWLVILVLAGRMLKRWLHTSGGEAFERLS